MTLTRRTDYSLRVLIYLGTHMDRLITTAEVAAQFRAPLNHVRKVVLNLGQLGYIETVRGIRGGVRLGLSPAEINLGRLVRDTETNLALAECLAPAGACAIAPSCVFRGVLLQALAAFLDVLDQYTLADLLPG